MRTRRGDSVLTPRQLQVLEAVMRGLANKEIASELGIGEDAVKRAVSRLLARLDAPNRAALVQAALRTSAARRGRAARPHGLALFGEAALPIALTRGGDHVLDFTNDAFRAELRCQAAEGASLVDLITNEAGARRAQDAADRAYRSGEPQRARQLNIDGPASGEGGRLFDVYMQPVRDGAGEIAGLLVLAFDVTAEVRSRELLLTISRVFERLPVGVLVLDAGGRPILANDRARAILGHRVFGAGIVSRAGGADAIARLIERAARGEIAEERVWLAASDGVSGIAVRASCAPLDGAAGGRLALLTLCPEPYTVER